MKLKIVVLGVPRKKQIISDALIVITIAAALLLIFYDTYFFYVILLIEAGLSPFIIYDFRKIYMESKRLYSFLKILRYDSSENKVVFSKRLKVVKGKFRMIGIRTPVLIYDSDSVYEPETEEPIEMETLDINKTSSYVIAASKWGTGFGYFDAYRIVNREYEGVVFFIVKKGLFKISSVPSEIRIQTKGCTVETIMEPLEYGYRVSTYMYGCGRKFKTEVDMLCLDEFYGRKVKVKVKIITVHNRFVERSLMRSEIKNTAFLIVTFPRRSSLLELIRILGLKTPTLVSSGRKDIPCKVVVRVYKGMFKRERVSEAKLNVI